MWRHPKDKINWDWSRPAYWQHMARTMERGLFDAIFIADELAPYNNYEGSSDATVKYAVQCPVHEPSTLVPILTAATTISASALRSRPHLNIPIRWCGGYRALITSRAVGRLEHRQLLFKK